MDTNYPAPAENTSDLLQAPPPEYRLFSINQIVIAALFGGPFASAWMVANNFNNLGLRQHRWKSWVIQILVSIISTIPDFVEELDFIPTIFYYVFYPFCAYVMTKYLQGNLLNRHALNGGQFWGTGRVVVVILINLLIWLALIIVVFILADMDGFMEIFKNR